MGLFNWLFGGGSKPEFMPNKQPEPTVAKATVENAQTEATVSTDIDPEIVAVIAVSINCVMDTSITADLLAAITVAVVYHSGRAASSKSICTRSAWALAGIQRLMASRRVA
ncbi:MAG: hypothetical protein H6Q76_2168 [Firmicutes bacterium]|nr:hypothetical protein [Bacillota bacterium]